MTDKELKKLNRAQLLEMLLAETEENERLRKELKETKDKLEDKKIKIQESGSLAEAALKLNEVFEAADAAAKQYLENIKNSTDEKEDSDEQ